VYPSTWKGKSAVVLTLVVAFLLLGCAEPTGLAGSDTDTTAPRPGYSYVISPGTYVDVVGASKQYEVTIIDPQGGTEPSRATSWSVTDPSIASISSSGVLVALSPGSTQVKATTHGSVQSVPVTVLAAPSTTPTVPPPTPPATGSTAEPMFQSGVHTSLWADDFEAMASTSSIYSRYITGSGENGLQLDATGGRNGSKGLRMEWRSKSGCTDDSHFIEGTFPASREVVVQYSVRYQAGFAFDWIGRGGPCSGNAKKLFFLWAVSGSRFDFISENHTLGVGSDYDHPLHQQNLGNAVTPEALGDGQWHRITLHIRQSSTPTATDGFIHGWIDGVQRWRADNIASHASGGWNLFKFPATFNQGSPVNQNEWFDDLRVWRP
jgi:hypothetical protein